MIGHKRLQFIEQWQAVNQVSQTSTLIEVPLNNESQLTQDWMLFDRCYGTHLNGSEIGRYVVTGQCLVPCFLINLVVLGLSDGVGDQRRSNTTPREN
ncbi:hypothetical protein EMIT0P258_270023 [Pseudomonas sp. IT-P258]